MPSPGVCVRPYKSCPLLIEESNPDSFPSEWKIALVPAVVPPSLSQSPEQQQLRQMPLC